MNIMHWKHVWHMDKCVDEWMNECHTNFTLPMNSCVKCVFNARYQCVIRTNYEWINVTWFPFLSHEMLSLWCHNQKMWPLSALYWTDMEILRRLPFIHICMQVTNLHGFTTITMTIGGVLINFHFEKFRKGKHLKIEKNSLQTCT